MQKQLVINLFERPPAPEPEEIEPEDDQEEYTWDTQEDNSWFDLGGEG